MSSAGRSPGGHDVLRSARRSVQSGRFRDAWTELEQVAESVRDTAEWLLLAAMSRWRLGSYEHSRTAALQARDRYRAVGDVDGAMRADNVAAAGAFATGDLDEAIQGFTRALTAADKIGDYLMTARCANNLGNVEYYRGRGQAALGFYRLAVATFERVSFADGLAEGWLNTAIVWRELGDLAASRVAADQAVEAAERARNDRLFAQALAAGGETIAAAGDLPLASAQVERALHLARVQHDPLGEADALRILALIASSREEYPRAVELGENALAIATGLDHPWATAEVHRALGDIRMRADDRRAAARAYHEAAIQYERLGTSERANEMRERARTLDG